MIDADWRTESTAEALSGRSIYGIHLSTRIIAARGSVLGGDWCEAFVLRSGVIAISIGDVCGHGETKYAARMSVRESICAAALHGLDPAQTLISAHESLCGADPDEYATAIFGLLDANARTFTFANAGHPAPLLCGMAGARYLEFSETFLPLGIEGITPPMIHAIELPEASLLVLYTDGVTEHDRKAISGSCQLRDAATFAYNFRTLPAAKVIQRQMGLLDGSSDDVAILTAWMPRRFAFP
jgi:serine phosphatase RsbU (regulator of sigma subunit)